MMWTVLLARLTINHCYDSVEPPNPRGWHPSTEPSGRQIQNIIYNNINVVLSKCKINYINNSRLKRNNQFSIFHYHYQFIIHVNNMNMNKKLKLNNNYTYIYKRKQKKIWIIVKYIWYSSNKLPEMNRKF